MSTARIQELFDPATWTLTYVVYDPRTSDAVVIDPVLDYDPASSKTSTASLEKLADFIRKEHLRVHYALETHPHADHLSGGQWLKQQFGAKVAIGEGVRGVQKTFKPLFEREDLSTDGSPFDHLIAEGEILEAGSLRIEAIATPGHTPACMSYKIEDAVFTGDALFIEDYGTGRCDFPSGSADALYVSVHDKLYGLPDATRVFPGHDYQPNGRPLRFETTIGASKETNVQLRASTKREDYVALRKARDATLSAPRLLFQSVQVNLDGGKVPRFLKMPVNLGAK